MTKINEIEAAAREAKRARAAADAASGKAEAKDGNWPVMPIAIGVGSAALVAALLYANRPRKK